MSDGIKQVDRHIVYLEGSQASSMINDVCIKRFVIKIMLLCPQLFLISGNCLLPHVNKFKLVEILLRKH